MIVNIDGEINLSYVQNLCLIFFPGAKFSQNEEMSEETPVLDLKVEKAQRKPGWNTAKRPTVRRSARPSRAITRPAQSWRSNTKSCCCWKMKPCRSARF